MADIPMIFGPWKVRSMLASNDEEMQTRRVVTRRNSLVDGKAASKELWAALDWGNKPRLLQRHDTGHESSYWYVYKKSAGPPGYTVTPRVQPGDVGWVREGLERAVSNASLACYLADNKYANRMWNWKRATLPSIFMPRGLCRLELDVTRVGAEWLQDITPTDCVAEGIPDNGIDLRWAFSELWESIHNKPENYWASNPSVWVYRFKVRKVGEETEVDK